MSDQRADYGRTINKARRYDILMEDMKQLAERLGRPIREGREPATGDTFNDGQITGERAGKDMAAERIRYILKLHRGTSERKTPKAWMAHESISTGRLITAAELKERLGGEEDEVAIIFREDKSQFIKVRRPVYDDFSEQDLRDFSAEVEAAILAALEGPDTPGQVYCCDRVKKSEGEEDVSG